MAVGGVDDDRDPAQPRRPSAQETSLGGVGVDDPGPLVAEDADQRKKSGGIGKKIRFSDQLGDGDDRDIPVFQGGEIGFDCVCLRIARRNRRIGWRRRPRDQHDIIAVFVQITNSKEGVFRRSALVEAGDDVQQLDFSA